MLPFILSVSFTTEPTIKAGLVINALLTSKFGLVEHLKSFYYKKNMPTHQENQTWLHGVQSHLKLSSPLKKNDW